MGLATDDPHSHKVQTKLYKIPKFGVNRPWGSDFQQQLETEETITTDRSIQSHCRSEIFYKDI